MLPSLHFIEPGFDIEIFFIAGTLWLDKIDAIRMAKNYSIFLDLQILKKKSVKKAKK